jgi:hypothetical protein
MTSRKTDTARLALLAAATLVVAACSSNDYDMPDPPPPPAPVNTAPTVADIADRVSDQDTTVGPLEFAIGDRETAAADLMVAAVADGTSVVPADGITLGGNGAVRTITLTPLEAATGTVNVTLTVTDAAGTFTRSVFQVTVNARPASVRDTVLTTFAKEGSGDVTPVNGFTFAQDADDEGTFAPLIPAGDE